MVARKSLYSLHPGFKMEQGYHKNLLERTGKTLDQWVAFVKRSGPSGEKARREWLKQEHGLTTNYANWIAQTAEGTGLSAETYDPDACVEAMFAGKEALRPLYDRALKLALSLGKDVKACPGKTIVPLYRNRVFAQLKPTTKTRIDLGLALGDVNAVDPLIATGGLTKGDRLTHRIALSSVDDLTPDVTKWLKKAYALDA